MNLGTLQPMPGSRKNRKRVGRGEGSGHGGTSCKGHKGQKARAGGYHKRGFEGGQMTLVRRLPKRGFHCASRREFAVVNVGDLGTLPKGTVVDESILMKEAFIRDRKGGIKILGDGEIKVSLTFRGLACSASARKKIEAAGGRIEEITKD